MIVCTFAVIVAAFYLPVACYGYSARAARPTPSSCPTAHTPTRFAPP